MQEAHEKLQQALLSLDSSLDVGSIDQNSEAPAASAAGGSASSQQAAADADGMQLHMRWDRYNPVHSVGLVTTGLPGGKPNLWVGLRWSTEFLIGCSSTHKESEPVDKVRQGSCCWVAAAGGSAVC